MFAFKLLFVLVGSFSYSCGFQVKFDENSPIKCQENCHLDRKCGKWDFSNYTCTLYPQNETSHIYFLEMGEKKVIGGQKSTKDVKEDALKAFQNSFDNLSESIPKDNSCKFLKLKRTLPEIVRLSNESVEHIQMIDSFLTLNDELLEDLSLIQTKKEDNVKAKIQQKDQRIKVLTREESIQNDKAADIQSKIDGMVKTIRNLKNKKMIAYKNAEHEHKHLKMAQMKHDWSINNLNDRNIIRNNAEREMNDALAQQDRLYSIYKAAEEEYHYQRIQHEQKKINLYWSWIFPPVFITFVIDTIVQYEKYYKDSLSDYSHWSRKYSQAKTKYNNANYKHQMALQEYHSAAEKVRKSKAKLDFSTAEVTRFENQERTLIYNIGIVHRLFHVNCCAVSKTKQKIYQAKASQDLMKKQILQLKVEVSSLKDGKRNINNEKKEIGKMKESVVNVQVLMESVNAGLKSSERKRESSFAPMWTFDDFEEAIEEVFDGIEEALRTMISDKRRLSDLGSNVSSSAERMITTIRNCKTQFGSSFHMADI